MFCGFGFGVFYLSGCLVLVLWLRFVCLVNLGFAGVIWFCLGLLLCG